MSYSGHNCVACMACKAHHLWACTLPAALLLPLIWLCHDSHERALPVPCCHSAFLWVATRQHGRRMQQHMQFSDQVRHCLACGLHSSSCSTHWPWSAVCCLVHLVGPSFCCVCRQLQRMLAMSRDDAIARSLGSSFEYLLSWPATADIPDSVRDQTFIVRHAWLVKVCCASASLMPGTSMQAAAKTLDDVFSDALAVHLG